MGHAMHSPIRIIAVIVIAIAAAVLIAVQVIGAFID